MQCVRNFIGYQYASRFISSCATLSITVWLALHQPAFKNRVFLSGKLCSVSGYDRSLPLTCVSHVLKQTDFPGKHSLFLPSALEPVAFTTRATSTKHVRLFQMNTEDAPVSIVGVFLQMTAPLSICSGGARGKTVTLTLLI